MSRDLKEIGEKFKDLTDKFKELGILKEGWEKESFDDVDWEVRDGRAYCPKCKVAIELVSDDPDIYKCHICNGVYDRNQIIE